MGKLSAITPFTLLDYPGELACIAWFSGCNLRCAYCHNPQLLMEHGEKDDCELLAFLKLRQRRLTAVVFSGGEATFCPSLPELMRQAKGLGYKTKLDTNGTTPDVLCSLLDAGIIDSLALDYKCPPHRSEKMLGTTKYHSLFERSLTHALAANREQALQLEIRTTYHPDFLDTEDLEWMINDLDQRDYRGTYWLQNVFATGEKTLGNVRAADKKADLQALPIPKNFQLSVRNTSQLAA